ncbi:hypothetical protein HRbin21_01255 [bacterium HR21]|nr:hypothetical protein HRbin21_01255 [bacterium HR21]
MRRSVVTLLLSFSLAGIGELVAQSGHGGMGYCAIGVQQVVGERFRQQLREAGYGELRPQMWSIGGGGAGWIGRVLVGGEGYWLLEQTAMGSRGHVRFGGSWGMATVGYGVPVWKHARVLLLGAIGGGGLVIRLWQPRELSFGSLLQEPTGSTTLTTGGWLAQVSLGIDAWLGHGWFLGVRVGYLQPLGWGGLALEDQALADAPQLKLQGISVRFTLGGGTPWERIYARDGQHGGRGS